MNNQNKLFEQQGPHGNEVPAQQDNSGGMVVPTQEYPAPVQAPAATIMQVDLTQTLPIAQIKQRLASVIELYREVMVDGIDYGVIPYTGDKPTLFKVGAELLCQLFSFAPEIESIDKNLGEGQREYRVKCKLVHMPTGVTVGTGIGSCSTREKKYYQRKNGDINNPADNYNTCLKMAKKRALVDVVLQVTGASRMFTQDVEDMNIEKPKQQAGAKK